MERDIDEALFAVVVLRVVIREAAALEDEETGFPGGHEVGALLSHPATVIGILDRLLWTYF
jgi:hypothetical protein